MMDIKIQLIIGVIVVLALAVIVNMIRKKGWNLDMRWHGFWLEYRY